MRQRKKSDQDSELSEHRFSRFTSEKSPKWMKWICYIATVGLILVFLTTIIVLLSIVMWRIRPEPPTPPEECPYFCSSQYNCPELKAVDLRQLVSWDTEDPETFFSLTRTCNLGSCFYRHWMQFHSTNYSEFGMGENWKLFWEDITITVNNVSIPYSQLVGGFFNGQNPVFRDTRAPWGDPFSSLCMAYLTEDSRQDIIPHMSYYAFNETQSLFITVCHYTFPCSRPLSFPGQVNFPIEA